MNAGSRPGARGGTSVGTHSSLVRGFWTVALCVFFAAMAWAAPATASVLYRCQGAHGETAYVSHTAGFRHCVKVGTWPTPAHYTKVAQHTPDQAKPHAATVLPGKPPRPVKANPSVLSVTPLGDEDSIQVHELKDTLVWQPLPVRIMDALGNRVLPRLLGIETAPAPSKPEPKPATTAVREMTVADPIPLKLDAKPAKPKPPRRGAVYRVVEKNGTVLYTNVASLAKGRNTRMLFSYIIECYACNVHSHIDWNTVPLQLAAYGGDIRTAARMTGVNAALLRAIIHAESGFNPRALSYKGAQGLMQLMPGTAFELGVGDAFDPAQNILGGARYLATLLHDYHGDVKLAAAAYNAGAGAVAKYGGVPPYAETRVYVKRVAVLYRRYSKALADSPPVIAAAGVN